MDKIMEDKKKELKREISELQYEVLRKKRELQELKEEGCIHDWCDREDPHGKEYSICTKCGKIKKE